MPAANPAIPTAQITTTLSSQGFPKPSPLWLTTVFSSQRISPALPALIATAKHRLLSSDFTQPNTLDRTTASFPPDLSNPSVQELKLQRSVQIPVQVLSIEDLGKSKWEQIEAIEAFERGETTKGREVIRVVPNTENGENGQQLPASGDGHHKLVLQDIKGQRAFGLELRPVPKVGLGMSIGSKMMLKGVVVARGMILLEPATATVLGGKIEVLHKAWLEGRKKELLDALEGIQDRN